MNSADELRALGNKYYRQGRYLEAIEAYSKAIERNPGIPQFYTNRALCYNSLRAWDKAIHDCKRAIELDSSVVKAFYFWGQAAVQLSLFDEAIKVLTRAHDLAQSQQLNFGDDITRAIREASRSKFKLEEKNRQREENELEVYLINLIEQDLERKLERLELKEQKENQVIREDDNEEEIPVKSIEDTQELRNESQKRKDLLHNLFSQIDDERNERDFPDYLCGKISLEILKDPVITPSGITYDRTDIIKHLNQVGHFDPVSRIPLTEKDLIPNLAMREVLEHFLATNDWARHEL
ncbi:unnamed protein product, partial [Mesorhabditis belari]|uniref:E3 ubiquitin-protein ligase CHIP n=1 Tax=Mesorhabditis belari TaxID=2138241 RepID=A0AAF3ETM2_9BILA